MQRTDGTDSRDDPPTGGDLGAAYPRYAEGHQSLGDVFGGWLLSQMDIAAGLMAGEVAQGRSATASVDNVVFHSPVAVGQTICIYANLVKVGRSSMDIGLEVWARDLVHLYEPERAFVAEAVFHYVAVDAAGRPRAVPDASSFLDQS